MLDNRTLVSEATQTGYYAGIPLKVPALFHAWIDGDSGVTGTVKLYGSNDPRVLQTPDIAARALLATVEFTGTGGGTDPPESYQVYNDLPYGYFFAEVTAISGTNAAISVIIGN